MGQADRPLSPVGRRQAGSRAARRLHAGCTLTPSSGLAGDVPKCSGTEALDPERQAADLQGEVWT